MEKKVNKLLWQSRRGMLEVDLILENFIKTKYQLISKEKQLLFERLLDYSDKELFNAFFGVNIYIDKKFKGLIDEIKKSKKALSLA